jgi:hypothetical protein
VIAHLPECFYTDTPLKPKRVRGLCICDRLLTCEQRVEAEALLWWSPETGYYAGFAVALDKAVAVVAAMPTAFWINRSTQEAQEQKAYVKAAIDALKGKP